MLTYELISKILVSINLGCVLSISLDGKILQVHFQERHKLQIKTGLVQRFANV